MEDQPISTAIEFAAKRVFDELGAGFTESVYHSALMRELSERGIPFHSEGTIPVMYRGAPVGRRRPDLFVVGDDGITVVELKASSNTGEAQLLQYLDIVSDNSDIGPIVGGAVIRFNDSLEYEHKSVE
jgi:GxxExxY protein